MHTEESPNLMFLKTDTSRCHDWQWSCGWQHRRWLVPLSYTDAALASRMRFHLRTWSELLELPNWLTWETHTKQPRHQKGIGFRRLAICYNLYFILGSRQKAHSLCKAEGSFSKKTQKPRPSLGSESHCPKDSISPCKNDRGSSGSNLFLTHVQKRPPKRLLFLRGEKWPFFLLPSPVCNSGTRSKLMTSVEGHKGPFLFVVSIWDIRYQEECYYIMFKDFTSGYYMQSTFKGKA